MRLWAAAHAIDDMYQGLVPASVPYFVLDRHYSYVAASGLALAATLGSSLPQPVVGLLVDKWRLGWMAAAGVSLAGVGAGLSGLAPAYLMVWLLLLASGLGVAMFHPAAGKSARADAGGSASAMSIFAAGGSAGFFLAPVLATPALVSLGLGATALFIPPAVLVGLVLLRHHQRALARAAPGSIGIGPDRWAPFLVMTGVEIVRSVVFFGVNTFIELYWIHHLGASRGLAGAALACFLVGGVAGTLLGGRIADRIGLVHALQVGTVAMVPALVALRLCPNAGIALIVAAAAGLATNIPFVGHDQARAGLPPVPARHRHRGHARPRGQHRRPVRSRPRRHRRGPGHRRGLHGPVLRARARADPRRVPARSGGARRERCAGREHGER